MDPTTLDPSVFMKLVDHTTLAMLTLATVALVAAVRQMVPKIDGALVFPVAVVMGLVAGAGHALLFALPLRPDLGAGFVSALMAFGGMHAIDRVASNRAPAQRGFTTPAALVTVLIGSMGVVLVMALSHCGPGQSPKSVVDKGMQTTSTIVDYAQKAMKTIEGIKGFVDLFLGSSPAAKTTDDTLTVAYDSAATIANAGTGVIKAAQIEEFKKAMASALAAVKAAGIDVGDLIGAAPGGGAGAVRLGPKKIGIAHIDLADVQVAQ